MNIEEIKAILPHREPFLLLSEIVSLAPGKRATGFWHLTHEMDFFRGHFPGNPVLPGVLQLESLAQTGAVAVLSLPEYAGKLALFGSANNVKFRRGVRPGETLRLETELTKLSRSAGMGHGVAYVGDEVTCEADLLFVFAKT